MGMEPWVLCELDKHSASKLHPQLYKHSDSQLSSLPETCQVSHSHPTSLGGGHSSNSTSSLEHSVLFPSTPIPGEW